MRESKKTRFMDHRALSRLFSPSELKRIYKIADDDAGAYRLGYRIFFSKWIDKPSWTIFEAALILNGCNPENYLVDKIGGELSNFSAGSDIEVLHDSLKKAVAVHDLTDSNRPTQVIDWADENGFLNYFGRMLMDVQIAKEKEKKKRNILKTHTSNDEKKCRNWLEGMMSSSPNSSKSKQYYIEEAHSKFSVSKRGFERAWREAISNTGASEWSKPGRRPRSLG